MASFTLSTTSGPYEGSLGLTPPTHSPWSGGSRLNWLPPPANRWSVWSRPSHPRLFSFTTTEVLEGVGACAPALDRAELSRSRRLQGPASPARLDDVAWPAVTRVTRSRTFTLPTRVTLSCVTFPRTPVAGVRGAVGDPDAPAAPSGRNAAVMTRTSVSPSKPDDLDRIRAIPSSLPKQS